MRTTCACGFPLMRRADELGCIECGRACCRACGILLESAVYCSVCARALMEVPARIPLGATLTQV